MDNKDFYFADKLLRAAVNGTKEDILSAVRLFENANAESGGEIMLLTNAEHFVRHILTKRGDSELLAEFTEACRDMQSREMLCLSSCEVKKYPFSLLSACLFSDDDIVRQMLGNDCILRGFAYFSCLDNPLYILMLCGKYEIMAEQLKMLAQQNDEISFGDLATIRRAFVSAAAFRDGAALKVFFENIPEDALEYVLNDFIPELAPYPDGIAYLAENFYKYFGFEKRDTPPSFREFFDAGHMRRMKSHLFYSLYLAEDNALLDYYLENISPVSALEMYDCGNFLIPYSEERSIMFSRIFAEEVTVFCGGGEDSFLIGKCRQLLDGHRIIFDLSQAADTADLRDNTVEDLRFLLVHGVNLPVSDKLCRFTEQLLDSGSRRIVSLMISKGIINKGNYGDAAVFLAENKHLAALDELNKAVF